MKTRPTVITLLGLLFVGCATTPKGPVTQLDLERNTVVRWEATQPIMRPVDPEKMLVYFRFRDSGGVAVDVEDAILENLERRGYRPTKSLAEAWYYLNVDVRHLDKGRLPQLGPIAAGGTPFSGMNVSSSSRSYSSSSGQSLNNQVARNDVALVVDIVAGERVPKGTIVRKVQGGGTQASPSGQSAGQADANTPANATRNEQSVVTEDDFIYYANRAVAITKVANATIYNSKPVLEERIARAMASALP